MDTKSIAQILNDNKNKTLIFGPRTTSTDTSLAQYYIIVDINKKKIMFTSDTTDYCMPRKLEEVLEKLFLKFEITKYQIELHIHKGIFHDKDIILLLKEHERIHEQEFLAEVITFIQHTFYKNSIDWNFMKQE